MKKTTFTKALSCILCIVLVAAMALLTTSCSGKKNEKEAEASSAETVKFTLIVKDINGNEEKFELESSKTYLLDALLDEKLVDGEDQSAGFYVKKVNGITADYDIDQTYWAFYINGEYAMKGVDKTPIEDGAVYSLEVTKG